MRTKKISILFFLLLGTIAAQAQEWYDVTQLCLANTGFNTGFN